MYETAQSLTMLFGRILLSMIFLLSGAMKIMTWSKTADSMTEHSLPAVPVLLVLAILFELLGGLSILLGIRARLGALALFLYLIPVSLVYHNFWTYQGAEMQKQMQHFLKNVTIMGGLLTVMGVGAGRLALDAICCRGATRQREAHEPMAEAMAR